MSHSSQRNYSLARRFHRHPRDKCGRLRRWDIAIWNGLHSRIPATRFCANLLSDGLRIIYRSSHRVAVQRELSWLCDENGEVNPLFTSFTALAELFDLEPDRVRADVWEDVKQGRITAKGILCPS